MKKQIITSVFLSISAIGFAQSWQPYLGNLYNSPVGTAKVGIGTYSPDKMLTLNGELGFFRTVNPTTSSVGYIKYTSGFIMGTNSGNDPLILQTSSVDRLLIDNSGKVGVNTSSPNGYLHVKNTVVNNGIPTLLVENTSEGYATSQNNRVQVNKIKKSENKAFVVENTLSAPGEVFKIYGEGRTLIGSSASADAPTAMLHIKSAIARESFRIYNATGTSDYLSLWHAGSGGSAIDPIGSGKLYLGYDQQTDIYIGGNTAPGNNASRLGIGTSNVAAYLHIQTPASAGSGHGLLVEHNDPNPGYGEEIRIKNIGTKAFVVSNYVNISSPYEAFKVYGDGRTHIGINPPPSIHGNALLSVDGKTYLKTLCVGSQTVVGSNSDALVQVAGKVACKSLYVLKPTTWMDKVFENDYKQMNLLEVEQFISKHKHLPGIKSENDVLQDGYDVNEMDASLLEKIENLYVYIIEQKKDIDQLKKLVSKLESK